MRSKLATIALALAIAAVGSMPGLAADKPVRAAASATPSFEMLHAAALKSAMDKGEAVRVYDANSRETYEKGHVPGAVWVESDSLAGSALPVAKNERLVFYCANEMCMASHFAAKQALAQGYTNVHVMPEGIQGWEKAGYPVVRGAAAN